ncbi:MAG TPA: ArsB/NhaD family transporter [Microbacteriaceae bacterium]|nr:ArsB/NhaD family transporter [Microbacteriaceae bacterium]
MTAAAPYLAIAVFLIAFGFIVSERVSKVTVVLSAAAAMALLGLIPGTDVFYNEHAGIDWNVIFLLFGMMIVVGVIKQTGLFDYLGIAAAKLSRGRPYRLMVLLMLITAIASPIIDNVTVVMLIAPVTIVVARRLGISPIPYLIAEILAANIGGASTLIGDPPNIIIGTRAGLSFIDFLVHMAPIVIIIFIGFVFLTRVMFRKSFEYHPERVAEVMALNARAAIVDSKLLVRSLIVLGLMVVGFVMHAFVHIEPAIVAMLGAGAMLLVARGVTTDAFREVEWRTLVFFMGLFVMVAGLVHTGVIGAIGLWAADAVGDDWFLAATSVLWGSAIFGALFDNIPYVATMVPIVETVVAGAPEQYGQAIWWAFALGADFGGNGTAIAASANVVTIGIAARAGYKITFWEFTKYGIITVLLTTAAAWLYIWLRYFV